MKTFVPLRLIAFGGNGGSFAESRLSISDPLVLRQKTAAGLVLRLI
jgi:hypothetical protein